MKILLLSFLFAVLIATLTLCNGSPAMEAAQKACMEETKVTKQELEDFYKSGPSDSTPANVKCQLKCLMEKMGHMKDGVFDVEKSQKDMQSMHSIDPKAFASCKNEKGANDCETAFKIFKCLKEFKA